MQAAWAGAWFYYNITIISLFKITARLVRTGTDTFPLNHDKSHLNIFVFEAYTAFCVPCTFEAIQRECYIIEHGKYIYICNWICKKGVLKDHNSYSIAKTHIALFI